MNIGLIAEMSKWGLPYFGEILHVSFKDCSISDAEQIISVSSPCRVTILNSELNGTKVCSLLLTLRAGQRLVSSGSGLAIENDWPVVFAIVARRSIDTVKGWAEAIKVKAARRQR